MLLGEGNAKLTIMDSVNIINRVKENKHCFDFIKIIENSVFLNNLYLGIAGSSLNSFTNDPKDYDFIIIIPDNLFFSQKLEIPGCEQENIIDAQRFYNSHKDIVIGTRFIKNTRIHVEIYSESTAIRLFNYHKFKISRIKRITENKTELFYNIHGHISERRLNVIDKYSSTLSFIGKNDNLSWGMHFERLILSEKISDSLNIYQLLLSIREILYNKIHLYSSINKTFHCFQNRI